MIDLNLKKLENSTWGSNKDVTLRLFMMHKLKLDFGKIEKDSISIKLFLSPYNAIIDVSYPNANLNAQLVNPNIPDKEFVKNDLILDTMGKINDSNKILIENTDLKIPDSDISAYYSVNSIQINNNESIEMRITHKSDDSSTILEFSRI